jgi:hypothetical protein
MIFPAMLTYYRVIAEAKRQFDLYTTGKGQINPNLRGAIFGIAIREGGKSEYAALKKEWQTTTSVDGRDISLRALGRIRDTELLPDFLEFLFNEVATQDMHTGAIMLAANSKTRRGLWEYIQKNFDPIKEKLGKNMVSCFLHSPRCAGLLIYLVLSLSSFCCQRLIFLGCARPFPQTIFDQIQ